MTPERKGAVAGYLLVSHGRRHGADVKMLPGAQRQLCVLGQYAETRGMALRVVAHDYARSIRSAGDIPNLFRTLRLFQGQYQKDGLRPLLLIDDYCRLFKVAAPDYRPQLLRDLMEYSDFLIDLRFGRHLNNLSRAGASLLLSRASLSVPGKTGTGARTDRERAAQTRHAREVSAVARQRGAARAHERLRAALDQFRKEMPRGSVKQFLESEEGRALCNSQGKPWSYRSALRALRDIKRT